MGRFMLTTTHGGYTFALGNCGAFYWHLANRRPLEEYTAEYVVPESRRDDRSRAMHAPRFFSPIFRPSGRPGWEFETQQQNYERSFADIRSQPGMFAYACVYRLYQLFNPLPHPTSDAESLARRLMRYAVAAWYVVLYLFVLVGLIRVRKELLSPPWLWGVFLVATFMAVHTFYWTNIRMRAPLMPFLCLVAAAGAMHLAEPLAHARLMRKKNLRAC
jgi:hypothetical protein